jgi:transaldolase
MKATKLLHNLGQSLWFDNITRDLLKTGTLKRYIDELSVTFVKSWDELLAVIASKSNSLKRAA